MKTLRHLLVKEFKQIFRNKMMLLIIFVAPVLQLLILPLAADFEIKNINIAVIDRDHSPSSSQLVQKITASNYFKLVDYNSDFNASMELVESDKADLILEIPKDFEVDLHQEKEVLKEYYCNFATVIKATTLTE